MRDGAFSHAAGEPAGAVVCRQRGDRAGLSALFVGAIAALDLGHMGRLLSGGETWPFAILLWFFTVLSFASVQTGIAIMGLALGGEGGGALRRVTPRPMTARRAAVRVRG